MARLRRSDCAAPGIVRRRRGRGFEYRDPAGEHIDDPEILERIADLGIPPAWREVWICMDPQGHLQATGLDAAARTVERDRAPAAEFARALADGVQSDAWSPAGVNIGAVVVHPQL